MAVRNFVAKTQADYIRRIRNFANYIGCSPDTATREDVRRYLLHLASSGMGAGTVNGAGQTEHADFEDMR
jgi:integrase/recombinase XerD